MCPLLKTIGRWCIRIQIVLASVFTQKKNFKFSLKEARSLTYYNKGLFAVNEILIKYELLLEIERESFFLRK